MTQGRPIRFGALLRQADNRWASIAESTRIADATGFDSIHFIDHLLALPDPRGDILEAWTTLTACAAVGRDPATLEMSLQDLVVIAPNDIALKPMLDDARKYLSFFGNVDEIATIGTPEQCIETLRRKAAQGITYFVCLFTDGGQPETVRLFGERVIPAFR